MCGLYPQFAPKKIATQFTAFDVTFLRDKERYNYILAFFSSSFLINLLWKNYFFFLVLDCTECVTCVFFKISLHHLVAIALKEKRERNGIKRNNNNSFKLPRFPICQVTLNGTFRAVSRDQLMTSLRNCTVELEAFFPVRNVAVLDYSSKAKLHHLISSDYIFLTNSFFSHSSLVQQSECICVSCLIVILTFCSAKRC